MKRFVDFREFLNLNYKLHFSGLQYAKIALFVKSANCEV